MEKNNKSSSGQIVALVASLAMLLCFFLPKPRRIICSAGRSRYSRAVVRPRKNTAWRSTTLTTRPRPVSTLTP